MTCYSILDLAPIPAGGTAADALANSADLAALAEGLGYTRYWLAEHHNMPGIASAATAVVIGHVAAATRRIRIGAGGIMLPNHAPLVVAEQFGTLATLHPGRIDLGVGRAPGTDQITARALRRTLDSDPNGFPRDVVELLGYFGPPEPDQRVQAVPGAGLDVPVWILGSSLFGAQLAAMLGLPYAFASHFAPAAMEEAIAIYRAQFRPSRHRATPHVMVGLNVFAADDRDEAVFLKSSAQQSFLNLRLGRPGPLPLPVRDFEARLGEPERALLSRTLSASVTGSPADVADGIGRFIEHTGADEIMITSHIHDHAARRRSFEITAAAFQAVGAQAAA